MKLIICEKPSQAKSVAKAVGLEYKVLGAVGHLFELQLGENSKWSMDILPLKYQQESLEGRQIENYELKKETTKVYNDIKKALDDRPTEIICATDPDFEGEAIYRTIIEYYKLQGGDVTDNQKRLIIKDTTTEGLQEQMEVLEPLNNYDGWRKRAYARAYADILLGFNSTIAFTVSVGGPGNVLSLGRVQTPTLKLIVDRYKQLVNHITSYTYGLEFEYSDLLLKNSKQRFESEEELNNYLITLQNNHTTIVTHSTKNVKPPKLHNLSTIQKIMNKKFKYKTKDVQKALQSLYDNQYTTYPRTDCQVVTQKTATKLKETMFNKKNEIYQIIQCKYNEEYNTQIVGNTSAHEGLTITNKIPDFNTLNKVEQNVYEEILKTCIANFLPELEVYEEEVKITVDDYIYNQKFKMNQSEADGFDNWTMVYDSGIKFNYKKSHLSFDGLELSYKKTKKKYESKPKPLFTEGTLLDSMKNAGKDGEDKDIFKDIEGIGTPATRSSIIEGLYGKRYITLEKNSIIPTEKGIEIIQLLDKLNNPLVNVGYTAELEKELRELENGGDFDKFIAKIMSTANDIIENAKTCTDTISNGIKTLGNCPTCKNEVVAKKGKYGKFYACSDKECKFTLPGYANLTGSDVEKILSGKKSNQKKQKSKAGKEYKCKYFLKGDKLEMEFVNKK